MDADEVITKTSEIIRLNNWLNALECQYQDALTIIHKYHTVKSELKELEAEFEKSKEIMNEKHAQEQEDIARLTNYFNNILKKKRRDEFLKIKPVLARRGNIKTILSWID